MRKLHDYFFNMPPRPWLRNWEGWIDRWDRMQERYLVARDERFQRIVGMIRATQDRVNTVVDLGCGTGSLTIELLDAFPTAVVYGVDLDPTLLPLAAKRCEQYRDRVVFVETDLRSPGWVTRVPSECQAVVSAIALHWLTETQLSSLSSSSDWARDGWEFARRRSSTRMLSMNMHVTDGGLCRSSPPARAHTVARRTSNSCSNAR